jgi:hypothetical protein
MTDKRAGLPLSRPVGVLELPGRGLEVSVEPDARERSAVAAALGLVAVDSLAGRFRLVRNGRIVHVTGHVSADVQQTCVVTLDAFPSHVEEPVDVRFGEDAEPRSHEVEELTAQDLDAPEPLVGGVVDLGALTTEFLALGLDPYPRKPGVSFAYEDPAGKEPSPFAALSALKGTAGEGGGEG